MFSNFDDEYYAEPSTSNNYNNNQRLSLDSGIGLDDLLDQSTSSCCSTTMSAESPPTKWPRISTPPAKPDVIIDEKGNMLTTFEAVNRTMALFSPPNRRAPFTSPNSSTLRTPKSGISISLSTPSPFRVTISRTPLKLSNNENVAGYHIGRDGDIKTIGNHHVVRCIGISNPKRCLIPGQKTPEKRTPFEGFNELPIDMTPGKLNEALCQDDIELLNYPSTSYDPMLNDLAVPTPTKPKIQEEPESFAIITHQPIAPKPVETQKIGNPERLKLDKEIEKWSLEPFVTPEKDLKVNCAQWIVVSTGKTRAQRELFGEATRFLSRRRVTADSQKIPTICRVGVFKHRYGRKTHKF